MSGPGPDDGIRSAPEAGSPGRRGIRVFLLVMLIAAGVVAALGIRAGYEAYSRSVALEEYAEARQVAAAAAVAGRQAVTASEELCTCDAQTAELCLPLRDAVLAEDFDTCTSLIAEHNRLVGQSNTQGKALQLLLVQFPKVEIVPRPAATSTTSKPSAGSTTAP